MIKTTQDNKLKIKNQIFFPEEALDCNDCAFVNSSVRACEVCRFLRKRRMCSTKDNKKHVIWKIENK